MLSKLYIRNYILIDELHISPSSGMNVITGETGAGKSIVMGALGLLMGDRADLNASLDNSSKCIIEGHFMVGGMTTLQNAMASMEFDWEDELIIRREISTSGKSRAFVNDSPASLKQLQYLSQYLLYMHQQFGNLDIRQESFQLDIIDVLGQVRNQNWDIYQNLYSEWKEKSDKLSELQKSQSEFIAKQDYNTYIFEELNQANFSPNELEELDEKLTLGLHAESVSNTLQESYYLLQEDEHALQSQLGSLISNLEKQSSYLPALQNIIKRLQSAKIELNDISDDIQRQLDKLDVDPKSILLWQERLDLGNKLLTKHRLNSTEELIQLQSQLDSELQESSEKNGEIEILEKQIDSLKSDLLKLAETISQSRQKSVPSILKNLEQLLTKVGMDKAKLKINFIKTGLTNTGIDKVDILIDANQTGKYQKVGESASGGELNRIMLCITSLIAEKMSLPTLIFDEIDSGVSGEIARQIGIIMKQLSLHHQIITITHQATIAARGDEHWYIYKSDEGKGVRTAVRILPEAERELILAEMISGEVGGESAINTARQLLSDSKI